MGGGGKLVCPTRGPVGDGSGPERSECSDPLLARGLDKPVFNPCLC